jgi:predicted phage terminase large subunit-like protein
VGGLDALSYRSKLLNMTVVERERLLGGNWKIRPAAGLVFDRAWFATVPVSPHDVIARVRYWDKAGTPGSASWTVGVRMALTSGGKFIVEHVVRGQWLAHDRNKVMRDTAELDGPHCWVWVEQEPGSGGKESAEITQTQLAQLGIHCEIDRVTGDKVARSSPMSWHAKAGAIQLVAAPWNEAYLDELHNFPTGRTKDQADASSGAFNQLKKLYDQWTVQTSLEVEEELAGQIPPDEIGERFL